MEKLKQYVGDGLIEIAKLDDKNNAQKVPFSELEGQVKRQQKSANLYKSVQSLSWDEKYEWVNLKRLKAKQKYQEGKYDEAIEIYLQSLLGIDLNDKTENRLHQMQNDLQYPITLNIATCLYKQKEYQKAIILCDKILSQNSAYLPAMYKKAYLLMCCGDHAQAKLLASSGIKMAKQTGQQQQLKNFLQLNGLLLKSTKQSQNVYAKMFNQDKTPKQSREDEESPLTGKKKNDEDEDILYYEEDTICNKVTRFMKNIVYFVVPPLNPRRRMKTSIHHSKSI